MLNTHGQVADHKALIIVNNNTASAAVELENSYISKFLANNKPQHREKFKYPKNSILYKALSSYDFKDEDILSEALLLLSVALKNFQEKIRNVEFIPFAITYIREALKSIKSKNNHTNSSDLNELIHSAIKIVKKNNNYSRLSHNQIIKLIKHFNLDIKKGYKKIVEFENIQKGPVSLEYKKKDSDESYNLLDDNNFFYSDYIYNKSLSNNPENKFENQKNKNIRIQIKKFIKTLNKKQKIIFLKRIYNSRDEFINLKEIAFKFNVSPQSINKIEKKLKIKLKNYFQLDLVDKKNNTVK